MQCEYLLGLCHVICEISRIMYVMYHVIVLGLIVSLEGLLFQSLWKISAIFWLMFMAPATCSRGEEAVGIMVKPAEIRMCHSYIF